ncbi:MAG: hypothetical protein ABFE01_13105 [Phycisphaerales bacterium]|jgi:hypothetical protein
MNREQKRALTVLTSMSAVVVLIATGVAMKTLNLRWLGVLLLLCVAIVSCLGGIVYFGLRPKADAIRFDERDREIQRHASLVGFGVMYLFLCLGSFAPVLILGEKTAISVAWLPLMVAAAGVCHAYAFFISLLVQYGRGGRDE